MNTVLKIIFLGLIILVLIFSSDFLLQTFRGIPQESLLAQLLASGQYIFSLVNKENALDKYAPSDLVSLAPLGAPNKQIRSIVYNDLKNLLSDAKNDGAELKIISAYRSYSAQKTLFDSYSKTRTDAASFSAKADHSEHQLGTTLDFGVGNKKTDLTTSFEKTIQNKWLEDNAWKYGFALSYPKDKADITGYIYEPWHYRFIGIETAKEFKDSGLILQEFLTLKPQYYK
jgi:LAS superfamily LD-carboxypeptidase LdcB